MCARSLVESVYLTPVKRMPIGRDRAGECAFRLSSGRQGKYLDHDAATVSQGVDRDATHDLEAARPLDGCGHWMDAGFDRLARDL